MGEKPGAERQRQVIFGQRNAPNEGCQHHILLLHINPPVWGADKYTATVASRPYKNSSDFHLHRFLIRGKAYGASRLRGCMFTTDARKVVLSQFRFRTNERFLYEYDFVDLWQHQIRFESVAPIEGKKS